jgi:hypothetical protein
MRTVVGRKNVDQRNSQRASCLIMMHSITCQERFQQASSVNFPWHHADLVETIMYQVQKVNVFKTKWTTIQIFF